MVKSVCGVTILLLICQLALVAARLPRYPVIIVPGDGGSRLEARIDKPNVAHEWCKKTSDWFLLWFNLQIALPFTNDCFFDNMKLIYDPVTHTTRNMPGVEIRLPGFGNTSGVERLDSGEFTMITDQGNYFGTIVDDLVSNLNYTRGIDVRAAPYDFRKAPNEMGTYLTELRDLVEDSYRRNHGSRVVLLSHSMGSLYTLYMLYQQTQTWKDKYIQSFISLAGPWGGVAKAVHAIASGDNLGMWFVSPQQARKEQRSMPSLVWLMPDDTFWMPGEVLINSPSYNYTVADYKKFFLDINYPTGYMMWQDTVNLIHKFQAPGVEVHCLHGYGIDTPRSFTYTKSPDWYNSNPSITYGDGDGSVNIRSLQGCKRWIGNQAKDVIYKPFQDAEHKNILHIPDSLKYIRKVLLR